MRDYRTQPSKTKKLKTDFTFLIFVPKIIKSEPRENLKERFYFEIDFFLKNQNTKTQDIYPFIYLKIRN